MSRPERRAALSQIHRLAGAQAAEELPDRQLLERFRRRRDEAAFAALVRRHGPLVWGVCWRVLGDRHDAEDAFQAAFLVLAAKAGSIRRAESLGAWLHRVARQLALRARGRRDRRRRVESGAAAGGGAVPAAGAGPAEELSLREALAILDEEVGRLPGKLRTPVVLCYLQGKTNEEAARELGCAAGTLKWRLGRARELLGERLAGRGVSLPAGATAPARRPPRRPVPSRRSRPGG
jgi:RNA polymerase sigma factor (sigma-70 family)